MVLGGVILKLEEFERAASEKDGGSGKGGGVALCFFFFAFGPQHSKKWWWWCWGGWGHCFFHGRDNAECNVSCLRKQHDGRD